MLGNFSEEALISRTNTDLVNTLGNLVNRTLAMSKKYFDSIVTNPNIYESIDDTIINYANSLPALVENKMNSMKLNEALEDIFELLKRSNKYIDETTPWILAKDEENSDRLKTVLYNLFESIRISAVLLSPFIPKTSERIFKMLNTKNTDYNSIKNFGGLETGIKLNESGFAGTECHDTIDLILGSIDGAKTTGSGDTDEMYKTAESDVSITDM